MPARFEDVSAADTRRGVPMDLGGHYAQRPTSIPDDIAITGLSGRLPESSNIEEFADNLFKGVDMVNDDPRRWPKGLYDLPSRIGKIKDADLENFDQQFFSVHQKQAECMDPQMRMLLESTHEAIIDAGKNIFICLIAFSWKCTIDCILELSYITFLLARLFVYCPRLTFK